ncbi:hypothetical protein BX659_105100 [Orenia metallireducens]|uniref:Uncharacterized protein n=1 Tax=Orenia metallireducens TaxID=1413210 RepID=A0A285G3R3_9FIRM|nr:hypothetical protein BX659_105100 [Orenia metallireducens]SNY17166.1 hypothetical protein SAMN06265827_104100 [Orenia metallireducens]
MIILYLNHQFHEFFTSNRKKNILISSSFFDYIIVNIEVDHLIKEQYINC